MQKDVEYRRDAKGWLRTKLGFSWTSVSTCGSRMVVLGLKWNFETHWPGEDDDRPTSFFPTGLFEPKGWCLKIGSVGWKRGCTSLELVHRNLTWHLYFPNKIGFAWEVGGNGEARVNSIGDFDGYHSIQKKLAHFCKFLITTWLLLLLSKSNPFFCSPND